MNQIRMAQLNEEDIQAIRSLETRLGRVCLLAVERRDAIYALEAKIAPNIWKPVDQVYPEIEDLQAYYLDEESARVSKGSLKRFLAAKDTKNGKRPIRIRTISEGEFFKDTI